LEKYAQNLRDILTDPILKEHNPDIKLLLLTPPPVCAWRWGDRDRREGREPQHTAELTALYAAKAKSVASSLSIPYIDLWTGFLHAAGWKEGDPLLGSTHVPKSDKLGELLADGLHFTAGGNRLCFRLVLDKIKEVYLDLDPERMEVIAPLWSFEKDVLAELKEKIAKIRELD
jgi:lysophospholipase L1-like esterase